VLLHLLLIPPEAADGAPLIHAAPMAAWGPEGALTSAVAAACCCRLLLLLLLVKLTVCAL
jgi:hypothetical protein